MYLTEPNVLNGVLLELGTYVSIKIWCLTLCAYNVLMFPVIVSVLQVHMPLFFVNFGRLRNNLF